MDKDLEKYIIAGLAMILILLMLAGCKNEETGEEFQIEPTYPKGKPEELQGLDLGGQLKA